MNVPIPESSGQSPRKPLKVVSALADQMMDGFEGLPEDPNDVVVYDLMAREFGSRAEFPTWKSR